MMLQTVTVSGQLALGLVISGYVQSTTVGTLNTKHSVA